MQSSEHGIHFYTAYWCNRDCTFADYVTTKAPLSSASKAVWDYKGAVFAVSPQRFFEKHRSRFIRRITNVCLVEQ
jgi:hypothetical protein